MDGVNTKAVQGQDSSVRKTNKNQLIILFGVSIIASVYFWVFEHLLVQLALWERSVPGTPIGGMNTLSKFLSMAPLIAVVYLLSQLTVLQDLILIIGLVNYSFLPSFVKSSLPKS